MGICLSCLTSRDDDAEQTVDENSPLLADNEQQQKQAEEELQMELRNKELNIILNSANEHLLDLGTFVQGQQPLNGYTVSSVASLTSQQQPQAIQDMTTSNISHVTSVTGNGTGNGDLIKVDPVDQGEAEQEIQRDLKTLTGQLGADRLDMLASIDTSKVGPLVVSFE
ncbi:DEKNAAC101825 [Brettanomyces naardenensis]|uniref:DEKNAAC101825 n=1 Tax=Brettanomyces naardenensis TaxID=13370 RepID=A0A448YJ95_BRENA|nr:DEKNAAC101825 [Brettanomyces naardenensis]